MTPKSFKAERVSRSADIILQGPIDTVFPLFTPLEEMKWEDGWNPAILYPSSGAVEEGMVFVTPGNPPEERSCAWILSKYQPENYLIQYIVSTENRCWVITVRCAALSDQQTKAAVTYAFTGLNPLGNDINKRALKKMYERDLKDWEEAINHFLKTGTTLKRP